MLAPVEGPTHAYLDASAACWAHYGAVLAREYATPALLATHRLSVDAYAVQHPGGGERRAVQSVGLHLARLMLQLDAPMPPRETNEVMLGLGRAKASLTRLPPPTAFALTVADVPLAGSEAAHVAAVRAWAAAAWAGWSAQHDAVRAWVAEVRGAGDGGGGRVGL